MTAVCASLFDSIVNHTAGAGQLSELSSVSLEDCKHLIPSRKDALAILLSHFAISTNGIRTVKTFLKGDKILQACLPLSSMTSKVSTLIVLVFEHKCISWEPQQLSVCGATRAAQQSLGYPVGGSEI